MRNVKKGDKFEKTPVGSYGPNIFTVEEVFNRHFVASNGNTYRYLFDKETLKNVGNNGTASSDIGVAWGLTPLSPKVEFKSITEGLSGKWLSDKHYIGARTGGHKYLVRFEQDNDKVAIYNGDVLYSHFNGTRILKYVVSSS